MDNSTREKIIEKIELYLNGHHTEVSNEVFRIFHAGESIDFNNLLTGILSNIDFALKSNCKKEKDEFLKKAMHIALEALKLNKQINSYESRVFDIKLINLNNEIKEILDLFKSILLNVKVETNLRSALPAIEFGSTEVKQIIMNLLINSRDALKEKKGQIYIGTKKVKADKYFFKDAVIKSSYEGEFVELEISDNGIGMSQKMVKKAFEPFYSTKKHIKNAGLGLASVFGIMKKYHGNIIVNSKIGFGTTIKVYFPLTQTSTISDKKSIEERKALVIVDSLYIREIINRVLDQKNILFIESTYENQGINKISQLADKISLIIIDQSYVSTLDFYEMYQNHKQIPLLIIDGVQNEEVYWKYKDNMYFLEKPFLPSQLISILEKIFKK